MNDTTTTDSSTTSADQASDSRTFKVTGIVRIDERRLTIQVHDNHLLDSLAEGAFSAAVAEYAVRYGYACRRDGSTLFDLFAEPNTQLPQDKGDIRVTLFMIGAIARRTITQRSPLSVEFKSTDEDVDLYTAADVITA